MPLSKILPKLWVPELNEDQQYIHAGNMWGKVDAVCCARRLDTHTVKDIWDSTGYIGKLTIGSTGRYKYIHTIQHLVYLSNTDPQSTETLYP